MTTQPKQLIIVYKDELVAQQLRKMIEEHDQKLASEHGDIEGFGPVSMTLRTDEVWKQNSVQGDTDDYVIFIGVHKSHDGLAQVMDVKYDSQGVRYGWSGKHAAITANTDALFRRDAYVDFLRDLANLPVKLPDALQQDGFSEALHGNADKLTLPFLDALWVRTAAGNRVYITDLKRMQQLFFGTVTFYDDALPEFLQQQ